MWEYYYSISDKLLFYNVIVAFSSCCYLVFLLSTYFDTNYATKTSELEKKRTIRLIKIFFLIGSVNSIIGVFSPSNYFAKMKACKSENAEYLCEGKK